MLGRRVRDVLGADGGVEDPRPRPARTTCKQVMLGHLADAVVREYMFEPAYVIDDNMRTIPTHYHAHAGPRGQFYGHGMRRS